MLCSRLTRVLAPTIFGAPYNGPKLPLSLQLRGRCVGRILRLHLFTKGTQSKPRFQVRTLPQLHISTASEHALCEARNRMNDGRKTALVRACRLIFALPCSRVLSVLFTTVLSLKIPECCETLGTTSTRKRGQEQRATSNWHSRRIPKYFMQRDCIISTCSRAALCPVLRTVTYGGPRYSVVVQE